MSDDYTPTVGEFRQAYVEASGASMAQESYYAEQVAEFERGIARVKADALRAEADRIERAATNITHVAVTEHVMVSNGAPGLLRESADRIEKEAGL